MAWSYNNTTTPGVLTSTGGTEASPDSVAAGLAIVQAANAARAQVSVFGAWMDAVVIRAGGSFIRIDNDLHLQIRGSAFIDPQNGGVIHGFRSVVRFNTNTDRTDNACTFGNGSSFICLRERPNDPSPRIDYANTVRMDYPNIQAGATPAKVLIQGLDLYNVAATASSYLKLYFGRATSSSVANVRTFNSSGIINTQYFSTTYNDSYVESLGFPSETIANAVTFNRPVFYRASPEPFNETIRSADVTLNNPTFLNNCWNGACSFLAAGTEANSKLRIQYGYTNRFKTGLTAIEGVNVRFTRARQSVNGSPTWTVSNAVLTATADAQGTFAAVNLLDAYREGTSTTNLERFNWTAKARSFNRRTAGENIFTNRVFYQHSVNMAAGYSEEVQMLDLAYAPATLAAGVAITGVSFDSAGNCTVTENRTALDIFHAWCSASTNNLDMPDVWRYDGTTLNMGAANLVRNSIITGSVTTTGTITGTGSITGTAIDANSVGVINVLLTSLTDTVELRKASDNSLIATRTGAGSFAVSPANVGVSVYFERKAGSNLVMSTITTPVTLTAGVNADVPLYAGAEVQVAQAGRIEILPTLSEMTSGGIALQSTLTTLASTNQAEHDATQAAIAALPAPLNSTQTQAAAAAALTAYDAVVPADLAGLALEASVQTRATQTSVSAIPTNPLLTTDTRLNNLDAAISTRSTLTAAQVRTELATELGRIDATVSSRATQTSVTAIPTNPLLTNDARVNNLDATVSSRLASSAYVAAPTLASIRADIERTGGMLDTVPTLAEVEASTVLAKQSGFTGLATATNVTNAQTAIVGEVNANEAKIDAVKADTAAIKAKTDTLVNTVAPTAAQIRTEIETSGSKLDTAAKKSKAAWVNTL